MESKICSEQLEFYSIGQDTFPLGAHAPYLAELGRREGLSGVRHSIDCGRMLADMVCRKAPAAARTAGVDFLLVDQNEPAGGTVAEHLGIPFITLCTSLPINREPCIPPPFILWECASLGTLQNRQRNVFRMIAEACAPLDVQLVLS